MAKVTYLGEGLWPSPQIEWDGDAFPRGQAVEVDDPAKIKKASANPAFKVELDKAAPAAPPDKTEQHDDDDDDEAPHRGFRRHTSAHAIPAPGRKK